VQDIANSLGTEMETTKDKQSQRLLFNTQPVGDRLNALAPVDVKRLSRSEELSKTLRELEVERLALLRRLSISGIDAPAHSSCPQSSVYLPSIHAHTIRLTSYTADEQNALLQHARGVIRQQIQLLNKYNEMKDIGQTLIGLIADDRNVTIRECQEEFGVADGD
jgi:hypothetical protein